MTTQQTPVQIPEETLREAVMYVHGRGAPDPTLTPYDFELLLEGIRENPAEDRDVYDLAYLLLGRDAKIAEQAERIAELEAERDKYGLMASQFASANEELGEVSMREKERIAKLEAVVKVYGDEENWQMNYNVDFDGELPTWNGEGHGYELAQSVLTPKTGDSTNGK